jgi:Fe2+ transport system protein FeoA
VNTFRGNPAKNGDALSVNTDVDGRKRTRWLSDLRTGEEGSVVRLHGGRGMAENLAGLGIVPGAPVRMISSGFAGPVVVACRESRVAIGRNMAERIEVVVKNESP